MSCLLQLLAGSQDSSMNMQKGSSKLALRRTSDQFCSMVWTTTLLFFDFLSWFSASQYLPFQEKRGPWHECPFGFQALLTWSNLAGIIKKWYLRNSVKPQQVNSRRRPPSTMISSPSVRRPQAVLLLLLSLCWNPLVIIHSLFRRKKSYRRAFNADISEKTPENLKYKKQHAYCSSQRIWV